MNLVLIMNSYISLKLKAPFKKKTKNNISLLSYFWPSFSEEIILASIFFIYAQSNKYQQLQGNSTDISSLVIQPRKIKSVNEME